jgi:hypothetical protein
MPAYRRLNLERIVTPEWTLPAEHVEAASVPLFGDDLSDVAGYS